MSELEDQLASVARALDAQASPVSVDEVLDRQAPRRRVPPVLAMAAAVLVLLAAAGVVFALAGDDGGGGTPVSVVGPIETTTTTVPDPQTTGLIPVQHDALPSTGLALFDGDEVVLVDFTGHEYGRGPLNGWYTNDPDLGVDAVFTDGGVVVQRSPRLLDPLGDGCASEHGAAGLWVAVCPTGGPSDLPDRIVRVSADGSYETITGPVFEIGHWRYALPSPDGEWILAQWSAECEVPIAYLVNATTGERHHVGSGDTDQSSATGWAPDGRAVVGLGAGECGSSQDEPGTYLLDPDTMDLERIRPETGGAVFTTTMSTALERRFERALAELNLQPCACYDHNIDPVANVGLVLDGREVFVAIAPVGSGYARNGIEGGVRATCGSFEFSFGLYSGPENPALLERARDLLLPHLYCVIPPP
jgi:hypothetical protein